VRDTYGEERVLDSIVASLQHNDSIPIRLRTALVAALIGPQPITTMNELAEACRCNRTTLWRNWKVSIGSTIGPKDVLKVLYALRLLNSPRTLKFSPAESRFLRSLIGVRPHFALPLVQLLIKTEAFQAVAIALKLQMY
jgi:hypothetical protein